MNNTIRTQASSLFFIVCFCFNSVHLFAEDSTLIDKKITREVSIIEYKSLCDTPNNREYCPETIKYQKGARLSSIYCKDIEKKYGNPKVVSVVFTNNDNQKKEISIPGITDILLSNGSDATLPVIAVNLPTHSPIGSGCMYMYYNTLLGGLTYPLEPGQSLTILILVSSVKKGDKLLIKYNPPLIVQ